MTERFLGVPYPITKHARGYFRIQSGLDQIKSDLLALILTNSGERVMMPQFGVDLRRFLFEPNDPTLLSAVKERLTQQIELWEPRVVIEQIDIKIGASESDLDPNDDLTEKDSILLIRISFFDPEEIKTIQQLKLEVPL